MNYIFSDQIMNPILILYLKITFGINSIILYIKHKINFNLWFMTKMIL